jgi:hypothetical protein
MFNIGKFSMCPVIEIPDELFARLESYAVGFDTPAAVIERLLNEHEKNENNSSSNESVTFLKPEFRAVSSEVASVVEQKLRVNSKPFLSKNFPELLKYKRSASRMYESKEYKNALDNWWFNFTDDVFESNEFIIFVGALDYENKDFRVFKVPAAYLLQNINKIDKSKDGWINLYVHMTSLVDLRNSNHLSFREFVIN